MNRNRLTYFIYFLTFFFCNFSGFGYTQEVRDEQEKTLISIIGTGDIMLGSNYPSIADLPVHDGKELLKNVKDILADADVTFGNLEGCFLDKGGDRKNCNSNCYFFRMPERYVSYLSEAGYDVVSIANNHAGDFGEPGRAKTQEVLRAAGINYAGLQDICETSQFEINEVKYGFIAFGVNTGTVSLKDIPEAQSIVSELAQECDIVIVSFHGGAEGKEHARVPKKTETYAGENRGDVYAFSHAVIDAGADVVFGHGPHVVRAAELYKDRFIIYSLGNFCTSGKVNINGINGYAPIVKVFTDKEGKFVSGQIYSALQRDKTGPVIDENHAAAKEIKRLTELDFPSTELIISETGIIERKKNPLQAIDSFINANIKHNCALPILHAPLLYEEIKENNKNESLANNIIEYSKKYLKTPYRRGTRGPNTFDCSGFTHFVFKHFGYDLNPGCTSQIHQGNKISKEELRTGDLIFFKGRNANSNRAGHVGIVISNDNGNISFIHACSRGVLIEELDKSPYYKPRYITGVRVLG